MEWNIKRSPSFQTLEGVTVVSSPRKNPPWNLCWRT